jgi:hypothetical protein
MKYMTSTGHPIYDGEFRGGKRNGHGVITWENGNRVEAEWSDDAPNGHGTADSRNGHYEGEFRDGQMTGFGTAISPDGSRYESQWRNGAPDGEGTLTRVGLAPFKGNWTRGCFRDGDRHTAYIVDPSLCQ